MPYLGNVKCEHVPGAAALHAAGRLLQTLDPSYITVTFARLFYRTRIFKGLWFDDLPAVSLGGSFPVSCVALLLVCVCV